MLPKTFSSDPALGKLIVAEGPPGSGKSSTLDLLAARGRAVIGEYATDDGATVAVSDHPAVDDDAAHQHNWLVKHVHATTARRAGPVWMDRDWTSALAYAYSLADHLLLARRAAWAYAALAAGRLALADTYIVFHVAPDLGMHRRTARLTSGHPWSEQCGLQRLETFYTDPVSAVADAHRGLGNLMAGAVWRHLHGHTLPDAVVALEREASQP